MRLTLAEYVPLDRRPAEVYSHIADQAEMSFPRLSGHLGVATVWWALVATQDTADVLGSALGKAVVANAATQILLRQVSQAIEHYLVTSNPAEPAAYADTAEPVDETEAAFVGLGFDGDEFGSDSSDDQDRVHLDAA